MAAIGGIEIKEGDEFEILGKTYVLHIEDDLGGELAVWSDKNSLMKIVATPNYDVEGIPIQIEYDIHIIAADIYEGKINGYDHYKHIVKEKAEELLAGLPKCKCTEAEVVTRIPIKVEGTDFYICPYCSGIIGSNEKNRKGILTKKIVIEELSKMLDGYFEEKSKECGLKCGDISPGQSFVLDDAIEKLADIVIQYVTQNKDIKKI